MGLVATPEMLEPHSLRLVKPGPPGRSLLPHPAQREEEGARGAPLRLWAYKNRERARGAPQRPSLKVRQTTNEVVRSQLLLYFCMQISFTVKLNPCIDLVHLVFPPSSPGVSWFISADELKSEARKENRPEEEESTWRPSTAWFEPYSRIKPWREPLRQRQVPEDGNKQPSLTHHVEPDVEPRTKTMASGLARMSLQVGLYLSLQNIT